MEYEHNSNAMLALKAAAKKYGHKVNMDPKWIEYKPSGKYIVKCYDCFHFVVLEWDHHVQTTVKISVNKDLSSTSSKLLAKNYYCDRIRALY